MKKSKNEKQFLEERKQTKRKKNNLRNLDQKNELRQKRKTKTFDDVLDDDEYLEDVERFLNKIYK